MILQLNIVGGLLVVLALAHGFFPAYFDWKRELKPLSLINRQMMEIHTLFVALTVLLMGLLCLTSAQELVETPFGRKVTAGLFVFWLVRLLIQFVGYSATLWRGKRFETAVHVVFSLLWLYVSAVFFVTAFFPESLFNTA